MLRLVARPPKQIRFTLGYDSYTVEGETDKTLIFRFETPPLARTAFSAHLAKAQQRERLAAIDATWIPDGLADLRDRLQLDGDGDHVHRGWLRGDHQLVARVLDQLPDLEQLSIEVEGAETLDAWRGVLSGSRTRALRHLTITGTAIAEELRRELAASLRLDSLHVC